MGVDKTGEVVKKTCEKSVVQLILRLIRLILAKQSKAKEV